MTSLTNTLISLPTATKAITWYSNMLISRPFATKAITTSLLCGLGDQICQHIENKIEGNRSRLDLKRSLKFSLLGLVYIAPITHFNFSYVLPAIAPLAKGVSATTVALKKVAFD